MADIRRVGAGEDSRDTAPLRQRLFARLEGIRPHLTLFCAPAGWGKTTVARILASRWERVAYCDAYGVTGAADLAGRLLAELMRVAPPPAASRLRAGLEADSARRVESARIAWRSDDGVESVTIFDNVEHVADQPETLRFLGTLFDRPHLSRAAMLCSRVPVRVRTSRFAAPHETWHLGEAELRLARDDLERIFGEEAKPADLERIEALTHGWPIAVLYLASVAQSDGLARAIRQLASRGAAPLDTYIVDEVLTRLSALERGALIACAAIGDCTADDLVRLLGLTPAQAHRALNDLPFLRRAPNGISYEVHPMVRALVLEREKVDAEVFLSRTAQTALDAGDRLRAAELFARCGRMRDAAAAIADTQGYVVSAPSARLSRILGMLDAPTLMAFPKLWSAAVYSRTYSLGVQVRLQEGRVLWSQLDDAAPFAQRAAVLSTYVDGCGVSGLLDEADAALDRFERSLKGDEVSIGSSIIALWRSVLAVWRSEPIDLPKAMERIGTLLNVDASDALYHFNIVAHWRRERGEREAEAAALAHGAEAAERAEVPLAQVMVWNEYAFHHWFWGDDVSYARAVTRLETLAIPAVYEGVRFFLACAHGSTNENFGLEIPKARVEACLVGAATSGSLTDAQRLAGVAVETADALGYPAYRILARVAEASLADERRRRDLASEAIEIARRIDAQPLKDAVAAFAQGSESCGLLTAFVRRYRDRSAGLNLQIFALRVLQGGQRIPMARRSLELLVALGMNRAGLSRERLADWVWPELLGSAGSAALRVAVTRMRHVLGAGSVVSMPGGYAMTPAMRVDLEEAERALRALRLHGTLSAAQNAALEWAANADIDDLGARASKWPWFASGLSRIEATAREAAIALARLAVADGRWEDARQYASRLLERDDSDPVARELLQTARCERAGYGNVKRTIAPLTPDQIAP